AMKNADNINKLKSSIESTNEAVVKLQETAEKTVYVLTALQDYGGSGGSGGKVDISSQISSMNQSLQQSKDYIKEAQRLLDTVNHHHHHH
uniref:fusion protein n=1 Tax=Nipah virus TaxID=3052225 RepID=UPI00005E6117|nr:Chain A, fusion protein [Henipavirus nipahense]1WP7_B Chain B, fusion protein [Henipavirus nipahense]1WP7_C Chain C, fusion protein [Henipavirus nipahense]